MTTPPGGRDLKPGTHKLADGTTVTVRDDGSRIVVQPNGNRIVFNRVGDIVDTGRPAARGDDRPTHLTSTGKTPTEDAWDKPATDKAKAAAAAQSKAQVAASNLSQGVIWVNGQRMRVTAVDANGNPTAVTYDNSAVDPATGKPTGKVTQKTTVFGALDLSDIPDPGQAFLMSFGVQRDAVGGQQPGAGLSALLHPSELVGKNMMSISNGLEWFANLATSDSAAYSTLVKQLQDAGYAPKGTNPKVFNADAAHAFALAARDLAIVNQRPNGQSTTLSMFLNSAQQSKEDARKAAMDAYQPTNRQYTDPAALAQTAKAAAQSALGRALTPDEEAKFESAFHGKESSMYDAIDSSGRAQAGAAAVGESSAGATFTRPDAGGQADAYINTGFAQEKAGVDVGKYAQVIQQMVGL
jgi:hypothetical protein